MDNVKSGFTNTQGNLHGVSTIDTTLTKSITSGIVLEPAISTTTIPKSQTKIKSLKSKVFFKVTANNKLSIPLKFTHVSLKKVFKPKILKPSTKQFSKFKIKAKRLSRFNSQLAHISRLPFTPLEDDDQLDEEYVDQLKVSLIAKAEVLYDHVVLTLKDGSTKDIHPACLDEFSNEEAKRALSLINRNLPRSRLMRAQVVNILLDITKKREKYRLEGVETYENYIRELDDFMRKSEELKAQGLNIVSEDGKTIIMKKAIRTIKIRLEMVDGYALLMLKEVVDELKGTEIL